jgi:hypothetical protein
MFGTHGIFKVENDRIGAAFMSLGDEALIVGRDVKQRA